MSIPTSGSLSDSEPRIAQAIQRVLTRYQHRIAARAFVAMGLGLGCLLAGLWRLQRAGLAWVWVAGLGGVGLAALALWQARVMQRSWLSSAQSAQALDAALDLQARLLTAVEFARAPHPSPLYPVLLEDTTHALPRASTHLPHMADRSTVVVGAILLALLVWPLVSATPLTQPAMRQPAIPPFSPPPQRPPPTPQNQRQQQAQQQGGSSAQGGGSSSPQRQQQPSHSQSSQSGASNQSQQSQSQNQSGGHSGSSKQSSSGQPSKASSGESGQSQNASAESSAQRQAGGGSQSQHRAGSPQSSSSSSPQSGGQSPGSQRQPADAQQGQSSSLSQAQPAGQQGSRSEQSTAQTGTGNAASSRAASAQHQRAGSSVSSQTSGKTQESSADATRAPALSRHAQGGGGQQPMSAAQQEALKADIQQLLKEMSGQLKQLRAEVEAQQRSDTPNPLPGTGTAPQLYGDATAIEKTNGRQFPLQLDVDTQPASTTRRGSGVAAPSGQISDATPQQQAEEAALADRQAEEQGVSRQPIPPEYRPVFERLGRAKEQ